MYEAIAKALISNADNIIDAIDRYLAKEDNGLAKRLKEEGYVLPKETVEIINSLEEEVADALKKQTDTLVELLKAADEKGVEGEELRNLLDDMFVMDTIAENIQQASIKMYEEDVPDLASVYMEESDGELVVDTLRQRTTAWMQEWSETLGELTEINTHEQITNLINNAISEGSSIVDLTKKIQEGSWRSEYYQARRFALTETLRAHSVAREESIQQSPATDRKEWRHTGGAKNNPRPNHVDMDGQIVPKDKPFELKGRDGSTYYPMYPRDSILPASESINCHCIHRPIVNDDILGMSYEERKKMQEDFIKNDDAEWVKEQDAKNKAKADINEETIKIDWIRSKDRKGQINYFGGESGGGKQRLALLDSGVITTDEELEKLYKRNDDGKRVRKTLKELTEDGIFTVSSKTMKHSTVGDFSGLRNPKRPAGGKNGGNMKGGGHSQKNLDELTEKGIEYSIELTYDNGVRIGGVANHNDPDKRIGNSGQSWFPEDWDDNKILIAGTYTANKPAIIIELHARDGNITGYKKFQKYDGVIVGVIEDTEHNIGTVFPDMEQREVDD